MPVSTRSQSGSTAARSAGEIKRPVLAAPHAEKQQNGGPTGKPPPSPVTSAVAYAAPPVNHFFPTTGAIRCVGDELCATIGAIERKRKALGEAGDTECTTADPTGNDVKLLTGEKPMQWHDNKYQGPGQELHSLGLVPVRVSYLYISCEPFVPHRDESNSDRDRSLSLSVDHDNDQLATHLHFSRVLL